ncbi:hypothetical protein SRIMHP_40215 (plasmid) [Streptomyces rimosus subsp. rimosus]|uniref:HNH endonuclease n=1 Tax=Streptomyces rimosus subsp. rimosus TaxID=132474 RepID=A0ABY3ZEU3_STRRM|nr:hypothetical protein SRIMR7_41770 [Streptomyces rimosus subsp. rimosus]UTI00374.1 hypothetical protein SRIMHP_40215 [Streptomyces rimosus subsp. rimosus]UTJ18471.1 hypothetical protein SRIMDV3_40110 [Streptomyces rimosus subsp. rimosus]
MTRARQAARILRGLATLRWTCWICGLHVDDYLTHCPIRH